MGERPSVLVVDDDESMLSLIDAVLENDGIRSNPCREPRRAAQLAATHMPDAIILDILMPDVSGLELLAQIRRDPATRTIPVLILSALGDGSDRVRGLKAGADDYLAKPFEPEELAIRVRRLMERCSNDSRILMEGRLGKLAAGDLVQQMLAAGVTGFLELGKEPPEHIAFAEGVIADARCASLRGEAALIVLVGRRQGRFRILESPVVIPEDGETFSLDGAFLRLAWLEDELERHRESLPPADLPLDAEPEGEVSTDAEDGCHQLDLVLEWFRHHPGANLSDLEAAMIVAPQQARLATALLVESALIRPRADSGAVSPKPSGTAGAPHLEKLEAACGRLADHARGMNRNEDVLHVLLAIDPDRWADFLDEIVDTVPDSLLERSRDQLLLELGRDGSASLRIVCSRNTLLVHIHRLSGLAGLRARAFLAMATAVFLAPSADPQTQMVEIMEAATAMTPRPALVMVPAPDNPEAPVPELPGWHVAPAIPTSLEDLLEIVSTGG